MDSETCFACNAGLACIVGIRRVWFDCRRCSQRFMRFVGGEILVSPACPTSLRTHRGVGWQVLYCDACLDDACLDFGKE